MTPVDICKAGDGKLRREVGCVMRDMYNPGVADGGRILQAGLKVGFFPSFGDMGWCQARSTLPTRVSTSPRLVAHELPASRTAARRLAVELRIEVESQTAAASSR